MADSAPAPYTPPAVQQRSPKPPGILPRNAQTWIVLGIALVMVLIIALSGRTPPPETGNQPRVELAGVVDPNQARIQEYRARIDEQAAKLAAEQAQMLQAPQALEGAAAAPTRTSPTSGDAGGAAPASARPAFDDLSSALQRQKAEIAADQLKRDYESSFAPNLVRSRRDETQKAASPGGAREAAKPSQEEETKHRVLEGTVIETVLTNRLDGSFSGPVNCMVTTNVYSHDRQKLLIPQGSKVLGEVKQVESFGQQRLAVAFHRLLLPNGYSADLEKMPGLNQLGETGLVDQVNRHYLQVFGVSLAIGAIAGLNQATTQYGADASALDAYRQGVTASVSQSSLNILDRFLNVLPTFTIREGHRVKVYLTADLLLPAYDDHRTPEISRREP